MKTQAEYYEQYLSLSDEELLYELRGMNAYFMVRENGYDGPTREDAADEKRALEQILEERGLENPGMQFGDLMRLELPPEAGIPQPDPDFLKGKESSLFSPKANSNEESKDVSGKGIIQIVIGAILAFVGLGLSLDGKGAIFYGAILGGLFLLGSGIKNVVTHVKNR